MKLKLTIFCTLMLILLLSQTVYAQVVDRIIGLGSIDWERRVAIATGIGPVNPNDPIPKQRATAMRIAKVDGYRNLLELVKGVQVTSETVVNNYMLEKDEIRTHIEGYVQGAQIIDERYLSDGTLELVLECPIDGIGEAIMKDMKLGSGKPLGTAIPLCPTCGQPWPAGKPVPAGVTLIGGSGTSTSAGAKPFTGLVIDASGLGVKPALAPKILNEKGDEVYGTGFVSREYAIQIGVTGYAKTVKQASDDERVTDYPLVVKGMRTDGTNKADIVISNSDAAKIHSLSENLSMLEKCRVMIIVGS